MTDAVDAADAGSANADPAPASAFATQIADAAAAARSAAHDPACVLLYRVVDADAATDAFRPPPAFPGMRWTSPGTPVICAALNPATALLEMLAHADGASGGELAIAVAALPRELLGDPPALPEGWDAWPYRAEVRRAGDAWLASRRHAAYRVPSAVATTECNVLLDPAHPRFAELELVDRIRTQVDPRLLKGGRD
jgi:RES domain-containing protein